MAPILNGEGTFSTAENIKSTFACLSCQKPPLAPDIHKVKKGKKKQKHLPFQILIIGLDIWAKMIQNEHVNADGNEKLTSRGAKLLRPVWHNEPSIWFSLKIIWWMEKNKNKHWTLKKIIVRSQNYFCKRELRGPKIITSGSYGGRGRKTSWWHKNDSIMQFTARTLCHLFLLYLSSFCLEVTYKHCDVKMGINCF